jgi:3-methyladenine DNA glycosylase/8-oxoguanine DNA glycosylase
MIETKLEGVMSARAQEIRAGLAWLHAADPVLAQVIDERPDFDPDVWIRRLPAMGLFGALVFQIIGQQISVIAATAIFVRLTERFGPEVADLAQHWRPYRSLASSLLLAAARPT